MDNTMLSRFDNGDHWPLAYGAWPMAYGGCTLKLVVGGVWPSAHIGGELQIKQSDTVRHFVSQHLQAQALRWCAFYADCRHELKPVEEG